MKLITILIIVVIACTLSNNVTSHSLRTKIDTILQIKEQIQVGKCHKVDSNSCITKEWSKYRVSKCSQVKRYCTSYNKNMHRCCPSTCGVEPICTKSECEKLNGKGTCDSLPDGSSSGGGVSSTSSSTNSKCNRVDNDACLSKALVRFGAISWKCASMAKYCTSYKKDFYQCCPTTCKNEPICYKEDCDKLSGKGECSQVPTKGTSSQSDDDDDKKEEKEEDAAAAGTDEAKKDDSSSKGTTKTTTTTSETTTSSKGSTSEKSKHTFGINSYKSRTTDVYEYHDYYAETRPNVVRTFQHGMKLNRDLYDYVSEEEAYTRQCVHQNLFEGRTALGQLAHDNGFFNELAHQCPYMYKASNKFREGYTVEKGHTVRWKKQLTNYLKTNKLPPKPTKSNNYYDTCSKNFNNKFTNGNYLNCLNCAIEQKLSHVHIKTTKERETQHHLIHALKVAAKGTKVYDECEETFTCAVKPKFTDSSEHLRYCYGGRYAGKRISSKTTCAKDCRLDMKQCAFKEMTKKMHIHKRSFRSGIFKWTTEERRGQCKRLMNIADTKNGIAKRISNFLKGKTFSKTKTTCPVSEHMNLLKENAVDVHVDTTAKDLQFKVLGKEEDKFLTEKNMKYNSKNDLVNIIYDCTKDGGVAYDRCQASLHPPQCKNERSENQVEVMDENGALMSTCTVWVKGVSYGIDCEDHGNRRRRLLQNTGGDS